MEISPIPGIRALPVMKTPPIDPQLSAVFDIEYSSKPDDDSYDGNGKKTAGGQDDEDGETAEEIETESPSQASLVASDGSISFFA
jgi:hypothetical protein